MSIIVRELAKPADERMKWIMWMDADSMILNQEIRLEIFLDQLSEPMYEDIHFLVARDNWGLNSGVFFIRVHPKTLDIFGAAFAYHLCHPEEDLGGAYDQVAFSKTLSQEEHRRHVLWAPRTWFNPRWPEILPGAMCCHFFFDAERIEHMNTWLDKLSAGEGQIPYEESFYPAELQQFWSWNHELRDTLEFANMLEFEDADRKEVVRQAHERLTEMLWHTDSYVELGPELQDIKERLNLTQHESGL